MNNRDEPNDYNSSMIFIVTDEEMKNSDNGEKHYGRGQNPNSQKHRFAKGTGNPKGRKPLTEEQRDALARIRASAPDAVKAVISIMKDTKARPADRLRAAEIILDRVYGKAPATVNISDSSAEAYAEEIREELDKIKASFCE